MVKNFSQEELKEIKSKLFLKEEEFVKKIDLLKKEDPFADPDHASDNAAVDTDVREQEGHERIEAQIKNLVENLKDIRQAIKKIDNGSYGFCERCHDLIPKERLHLLPEARYCVNCERAMKINA